MKFETPLIHGTLIRRYKRFLADVRLDDGTEVIAHCANTGSMKTCAEPGWRVLLSPANNPKRKLKWTWEIVFAGTNGHAILINTARPNRIVHEAIAQGRIKELSGYDTITSEVKYGEGSRIDLLLTAPEQPQCFVEVKNVTMLKEPGCVTFPDSVSTRATKHMNELALQVRQGHRAVVFFLVSRMGASEMTPADIIDPRYGEALRQAVACGVEALAYCAEISEEEILVGQRIPIRL
jgi:sugar fermentation stimulation protein A